MPFYDVYGKWFHLQYSEHFSRIVKAPSPEAALLRFARCFSEVTRSSAIEWETSPPEAIKAGLQDPKPAFMVGGDQIYQVRAITTVKPTKTVCPTCEGSGSTRGYVVIEGARAGEIIHGDPPLL